MQGLRFTELPTRPCPGEFFSNITKEEQDDIDESGFYRVDYHSRSDVYNYGSKMLCIADSDVQLWGNYDTAVTANLMIVFETCSN